MASVTMALTYMGHGPQLGAEIQKLATPATAMGLSKALEREYLEDLSGMTSIPRSLASFSPRTLLVAPMSGRRLNFLSPRGFFLLSFIMVHFNLGDSVDICFENLYFTFIFLS